MLEVRRGFFVFLHQLEEVGLVAVEMAPFRLSFHRFAPGIGLHAAGPATGAPGAAAFDDHVAVVSPSRAAAQPRLAAEDQPAADDAGAPEDADQAVVALGGAEVKLGFGRDLDVVADRTVVPSASSAFRRAGSCPPSREGCRRC